MYVHVHVYAIMSDLYMYLFISQGCIGIVKGGTYKYKGLPCPNPEDAKQSAAAIAISNLPVRW